uniref:Uncharacterized protein n=1 Tax=viral metagenome TaxID=1070528 RepID=A0A6C0EAY3_9ZZZZ
MNKFKLCIIGDSGVGKTSIVEKLVNDKIAVNTETTIGAMFSFYKLSDDTICNIYDTAGQERYRSIAPLFYRNANLILLVYDVTNKKSLDSLVKWQSDIYKTNESTKYIVIGNKIDKKRVIEKQDLDAVLDKLDKLCYVETSIFDDSIEKLKKVIEEQLIDKCTPKETQSYFWSSIDYLKSKNPCCS